MKQNMLQLVEKKTITTYLNNRPISQRIRVWYANLNHI